MARMAKVESFHKRRLKIRAEAQAGENISFNLHSLGWSQFQDLSATVMRVVFNQDISTFARTSDGGRDGAFYGRWRSESGQDIGSGTVQCKFTARRNVGISIAKLDAEIAKARELGALGLASTYVLITNMILTGVAEAEIINAFMALPGIDHVCIYGDDWLTSRIRENAHLRMLIPRVYGIGDLSQILDERYYNHAREILSYLGDELKKFVVTDAYKDSVRALSEFGFVLLLGAPATGKSTIASALALGAIDRWETIPIRVTNGKDFESRWNPDEKQFFWIDDVFGATQYQASKSDDWVQVFPQMSTAIARGAKIIFTSRTYIFHAAVKDLKTSAFTPIRESKVQIIVEDYKPEERKSILYNHLRLGSQSKAFKTGLKNLRVLSEVADHPRFTPVVARRLADPSYTRRLRLTKDALLEYVDKQGDHVIDALEALDVSSYGALSLIFMNGGSVEAPLKFSKEEEETLASLGTTISQVKDALKAMEGNFVRKILQDASMYWRFDHPSIGDALSKILMRDIDQLEVYLRGAKLENILEEVSCGSVIVEGSVVVPRRLYDTLLDRIEAIENKHIRIERVNRFLALRADGSFLALYSSRHPAFFSDLAQSATSGMGIHTRLVISAHRHQILSKVDSGVAARAIISASIKDFDSAILDHIGKGLLTRAQIADTLGQIRLECLPRLDDFIDDVENQYEKGDDPADHFDDLINDLTRFRKAFRRFDESVAAIDKALQEIELRIDFLTSEFPKTDADNDDDNDFEEGVSLDSGDDRDVFEDVDEPSQ